MNEFDDLAKTEKEFPKEQWEWYAVRSADEATRTIASLVFLSNSAVFGEARWFSENNGVVLVKKSDLKTDEQIIKDIDDLIENPPEKAPWYKRIFGLK